MKIVFLDIDGVMNCQQTAARTRFDGFDEIPSQCLRHIVETTGAKIVVTGALGRTISEHSLRVLFRNRGIADASVIGVTRYREPRGDAITEWLNEQEAPVTNFVILDDAIGAHLTPHGHRLVRTNWRTGMTAREAQQAISMLSQ
ncbi:MAG: hypothetical protein KBC02_02835 [Candidatus Pacebacteria bacterium]|nr:hypothetical protein [Candidatus Paceibacterota bacterium]